MDTHFLSFDTMLPKKSHYLLLKEYHNHYHPPIASYTKKKTLSTHHCCHNSMRSNNQKYLLYITVILLSIYLAQISFASALQHLLNPKHSFRTRRSTHLNLNTHAQQQSSSSAITNICGSKGWIHHNDACYKIFLQPKNSESAKNKCNDTGGGAQLAPVDEDTNEFFVNLLRDRKDDPPRQFFVNVSDDLFTNFFSRQHEPLETESSSNEVFFLTENQVSFNNTPNSTKDDASSKNAFAYVYSQVLKRWGLLKVDPMEKKSFICERFINKGTQKQASKETVEKLPQEITSNISGNQTSNQSQDTNILSIEPKSDSTKNKDISNYATDLFREYPEDQWVVIASTVEMKCSPVNPELSVSWTLNGKNIISSRRFEIFKNGTLKIDAVRNTDVGEYTCTIMYNGGSKSKSAKLEIIELPHPPESISAELLDKMSSSVLVKWTPGFNGNSPITKFTVEMKIVEEKLEVDATTKFGLNSWEIAKTNISADQFNTIVSDLKPARRYIFRVKATNKVGTGMHSNPTKEPIEVPIQPPSSAPENLSGIPRSSTSISLHWSPPPQEAQNGVLKGYKIRHRLAGYGESNEVRWFGNDILDAVHRTFTLEDLIVWQSYEIQIAAENDKGSGPWSSSIFVRTKEGKPDRPPRNIVGEALNPQAIKVSWDPAPPQHLNGVNKGYKVQIYLDQSSKDLVKSINVPLNSISSSSHNATIDGLAPFTIYYVGVLCYTSAGDGPMNEELVAIKTKEDLPEAVELIEFNEVLEKSVRISWKPPQKMNGELVSYSLEYVEANSSSDGSILKTFSPNMTEAKIIGLKPQTKYNFRLVAHNGVGHGPAKSVSVTTKAEIIEVKTTPAPLTTSEPALPTSTQPNNTATLSYGASQVFVREVKAYLPFLKEPWFVAVCAISSVFITIIITLMLFIQNKTFNYKQKSMKSSSQDTFNDGPFSPGDDFVETYHDGFRIIPASSNNKRITNLIEQDNAANITLPKTPPRPYPSSAAYSEDGDEDVFEAGKKPGRSVPNSAFDSSDESMPEKPSERSSSSGPGSESAEEEYINMANRTYANMNGGGAYQCQAASGAGWKQQNPGFSTNERLQSRMSVPAPVAPEPSTSTTMLSSSSSSQHMVPSTSANGASSSDFQNTSTGSSNGGSVGGVGGDVVDSSIADKDRDLLGGANNCGPIINLNGGRIIVDNMAGSRAPLPGFTSFV